MSKCALGSLVVLLGGCLTMAAGSSLRSCNFSNKPDLRVKQMGPKKRRYEPKNCQLQWVDTPTQRLDAPFVQYGEIILMGASFGDADLQAVHSWACKLGGSHIMRRASPNKQLQKFTVWKLTETLSTIR